MTTRFLFLKAMVAGHIKSDGTVVRTYHRKDDRSVNARFGRVIAAIKRAEAAMSPEAQNAVAHWDVSNWHINPLQGAFRGDPKRAALRQEMEEAMIPVRRVLRDQFGATITLHRGERHYHPDSDEERGLYSWTLDPHVARDFAQNGHPYRVMPQAEIDRIVASYEATGFAKSGRRRWMRDPHHPDYFLIYDHHEMITDGEDLRGDLERARAEAVEHNAELAARGRIYTEAIPVEDIAWIISNPHSREFLVSRAPGRTPPPGA